MAQVTIDMCNHIISAADKGERFPLTVNELKQLAYLARNAHEEISSLKGRLELADAVARLCVACRGSSSVTSNTRGTDQ